MAIPPPLDEMITPLHGVETNTVPRDMTTTATSHPATGTETAETEIVKNDIVIQKNLPTIEVLTVTVAGITLHLVVVTTVPTEVNLDLQIGEITVLVEVKVMITLLREIENLVMIVGEVDQIDLMALEEEDLVVVDLVVEEIGNGVLLRNVPVEQLQI